jgi:hypothetical protein
MEDGGHRWHRGQSNISGLQRQHVIEQTENNSPSLSSRSRHLEPRPPRAVDGVSSHKGKPQKRKAISFPLTDPNLQLHEAIYPLSEYRLLTEIFA